MSDCVGISIEVAEADILVERIEKEGVDALGEFDIRAGDVSLTDGPREVFLVGHIMRLVELVPALSRGECVERDFIDSPPDTLTIHPEDGSVRVNVVKYTTRKPLNPEVPEEGMTVPLSELLTEIIRTGRKIHSVVEQSGRTTHPKTRKRLVRALEEAEDATTE